MFPWHCVTGHDTCSKEWGGGKLAEETILFETAPPPLPESIETHEDSYSEFWVRRAQNTYFFFPVGTLVQSAMTAFSGRILGCREAF